MAWLVVILAVAVAIALVILRRGVPRLVFPGERSAEVPPPPKVVDEKELLRTRTLYTAFRQSDEITLGEDSAREDRRILERALQLLADQVGAQQAVLWRPEGEDVGLEPVAWCIGTAEPAVSESERLLIELSATEQKSTHDEKAGASLSFIAVGVMLGNLQSAVSVHFDAPPARARRELTEFTYRHARTLADLYELARIRAALANRTNRLWSTIRTAKALQATRDPEALEQALVRDATKVAGAEWAMVVRWDAARSLATLSLAGEGAPDFGEKPVARPGSIVGDVCRSGKPQRFSDTRPQLDSQQPVFDNTPLPPGTMSLLVVPLRRSESDADPAIGALLLGHSERGAMSQLDARGAYDLGTIATGALETAWAVRDETRRARTDPLTGLPNRRAFDEAFARMLAETDRYGGASALVIADIDHFKRINDSYGHKIGDEVLKVVGGALAAERRTTDFVARLGGEEFALLLPQTDDRGALEVAERVRERLQGLQVLTTSGEVTVTSSFGVALYVARSGRGAVLFDRADAALYAAKNAGRNRVEVAPADAPSPGEVPASE